MLKRIHIKGYKSLNDVEVNLFPLTVLFGPNGVGKSNFLDALQLVSKLGTSSTLKEAFAPPYRGEPLESFSLGKKGLKGLLAQRSLSFSIEIDLHLSDAVVDDVNRQVHEMSPSGNGTQVEGNGKPATSVRERDLRYRIQVEMLPKSGILRVADEYLAALTAEGEPAKIRLPFIEKQKERIRLRLERRAHPTYHSLHLGHSILSMPHSPPDYPHVVAARRELERWLFFYFEPRERMRSANPVKEVRHIGPMGEGLAACLNTLKALEPKQFMATEKALHTLVPNVQGIDVDVSDLGEVEMRLVEDGVAVSARLLSDGTLRMLGLLALSGAGDPPALTGFEEPENGVHPSRIQFIAELLKNRARFDHSQYIVTTHSLILPDLLPDESLQIVRRIEGRTRIDPFLTWGPLGRTEKVADALDGPEKLPFSERALRGDFDA